MNYHNLSLGSAPSIIEKKNDGRLHFLHMYKTCLVFCRIKVVQAAIMCTKFSMEYMLNSVFSDIIIWDKFEMVLLNEETYGQD